MSCRFAVYALPSGALYDIGSSVVGYDISDGRPVQQPEFMQAGWNDDSAQYGFHLSVTDAITIDEQQLPDIAGQLKGLLESIGQSGAYELAVEHIGFWNETSTMAVIRLQPDRRLQILHDVLVSRLHPLGNGSAYTATQALTGANRVDAQTATARLQLFYSPYIFEDFIPHLTCIGRYEGQPEGRQVLEAELQQVFAAWPRFTLDRLALVAQYEGQPYFTLVEEFSLRGRQ